MTFLQQIGKQVHKAEELKVGDIVGKVNPYTHGNYEEIRLYYVEKVDTNPTFIKWFGPRCPHVAFKEPHLGFTYSEKGVGRTHLHTPSQYECNGWYEMPYAEAIKDMEEEDNPDALGSKSISVREWNLDCVSLCKEHCFDLYLITDEYYKKMGNLIPHVEMPKAALLFQTLDANKVFDYVRDVKEDIVKFKELFIKINKRALQDG